MKLKIIHYPKMNRAWLVKREHGKYEQHAHFFTKKEAEMCIRLIDACKYPRHKKYVIAMQRLLTEDEFKKLKKKQKFYRVNKGFSKYR